MAATAEVSVGARPRLRDSLRSDRFIVSPAFDGLFFIGSPLVAIAAVLGAVQFVGAPTVEAYVLTYMALGHHVPTFLRAYGDPDEFAANRFRLIAIPLLVVPLMGLLYVFDSRLLMLVFVWDQYHFVRQHYGFMRIYDAKNKSISPSRFNVDLWLCMAWFVAIIAYSDFYSYVYAGHLLDLGLLVPAGTGNWLRTGSLAVAGGLTLLFVVDHLRGWTEGRNVALLKMGILGSTYGVWYYAYVMLSDPLLSYAISSTFHCLQYDALTWHYNRRKAMRMQATPRNAVFRYLHSSRAVLLYVLAIASYGLVSQVGGGLAPGLVFLLNRTTGVLHYYYDSFIWQVKRTQADPNRRLA